MVKGTRVRKILTYTGVAALVAVAVNLVLSVINSQKQKEKKRGSRSSPPLAARVQIIFLDHHGGSSLGLTCFHSDGATPGCRGLSLSLVAPWLKLQVKEFCMTREELVGEVVWAQSQSLLRVLGQCLRCDKGHWGSWEEAMQQQGEVHFRPVIRAVWLGLELQQTEPPVVSTGFIYLSQFAVIITQLMALEALASPDDVCDVFLGGKWALCKLHYGLFVKVILEGYSGESDLLGLHVFVNLSASEIHRLADQIIAKSNETHDLVSSVPLENVTYKNVICPLMDLEEQQYPLVQSCLFPKMVATSEDVRKASADAEKKLDSHFLKCRKREDVYRVIKAFVKKGEWLDLEARRYVQCLVKEFERSGMNLTSSKLEEMESLRSEMEKLSFKYIHNLNNDASFLLLSEGELDGMPPQFMKSLNKTDGGKMKVLLKTYHVLPILEYCKLGATRKSVAAAYWQRCGRENLHILENLVQLRHKYARLLGYSSYADFVTETRMAKTSIKVEKALFVLYEILGEKSIYVLAMTKRRRGYWRMRRKKYRRAGGIEEEEEEALKEDEALKGGGKELLKEHETSKEKEVSKKKASKRAVYEEILELLKEEEVLKKKVSREEEEMSKEILKNEEEGIEGDIIGDEGIKGRGGI
ncbi:hypothetical protein HPP92_008754 [Vanilla planifolia]|uniref:Peptidase M3A/M3B catalytic domain-containing protein n=1 Tax=Vanilla planifolia TaxID=51239 RepID=A0A835RCZ6_VANPL|nr:hypothetical protein HPP92_008754 [Vanilla planifolia]